MLRYIIVLHCIIAADSDKNLVSLNFSIMCAEILIVFSNL